MPTAASPTVSVIIPCHNSAATLPECLRAVLAQTHAPVEVIVADDGSTDATREIAEAHGCVVLAAETNGGPSAARNRGVRASSGEVLFFLDSDVAIEPDAVANAVRLLGEDDELGCVHGMYTTEPLAEDTFVARYRLLHSFHWHQRNAGRVRTAFFALGAMPRRVFDEVGEFDERLRDSEDVEYSDRLSARFAILLTEEILGSHDDETRLWPMLRKQFLRARMLVPVALVERGGGRGAVRANRFSGVIAAGLAAAALPLGLLWTPMLAVAGALVLVFAAADPPLSRFVLRRRGPAYLAAFTGVHFLLHLAIVGGAAVGAVRALVDPEFGPSRRTPAKRGRVVASVLLAAVLATAVVLAFRELDWHALGESLTRPAAVPVLLGSVAANLAALVLAMLSWRAVLVDGGPPVGLRQSARVFFIGMITKFVPGRVWAVLTHARAGHAVGVAPGRMVAVYLLTIPVGLLTAALVALVAAPWVLDGGGWLLALPSALAVVVFLRPGLVNRLVALALRLLKREQPRRFAAPGAMRASLALSLVSWLVAGLHLWGLAVFLGADPLTALPVCVGGFAAAMLVGSLAVVVPDGIGAREVVLMLPMAAILPWPTAVVAVLLSRIVVLVSEVLGAGLAVLAARSAAPAADGRTALADR